MPSWGELVSRAQDGCVDLDALRHGAVSSLASYRNRNVICYYSGWLQRSSSPDIAICDNDMNGLMNALHGLDRKRGLDLVLHTPGGDLAATEAIVSYIKSCFGSDVCAIVPQLAMSAGTMVACSCKKIVMGRQSSLGPTDPQLGGVAAGGVVEEFEHAVDEVGENPASAALWAQIIGKYHPTFLGDCKKAMDMSRSVVSDWLRGNMLNGEAEGSEKVEKIIETLCDHRSSAMHNRHFSSQQLSDLGLKIEMMEDDDDLQDLILTVHHAFMISFQKSGSVKIIENDRGACWIINSAG